MSGDRPRGTRRITALAAAATLAAALVAVLGRWGSPTWWAGPVLLCAVAASEIAVVHMAVGRQRWTFSLTEGVVAAALVLVAGTWVVPAVAVGAVVAQAARRQPWLKLAFNVGQFGASAAAASAMATLVGGGVPGGIAGMGAFWFTNNAAVAGAVSAATGRRALDVFRGTAPLAAVHATGTASMGLLAGWLAIHSPLGLLGLVIPLALLWSSYDEQTARAAEARLFEELARGQRMTMQESSDATAQVVLTAAARIFGGADVEMLLLDPEGPVCYRGDEGGAGHRRRVDMARFDEPWALRALGTRGVSLWVDEGQPTCAAAIGPAGSPLALLVARRPVGATPFGRREASLAAVLVQQAESWLSVAALAASRDEAREAMAAAGHAARALGDLGAHTAPALVVLRDSAARLARLATSPEGQDPVGDIVEELHAAERAVASLLGAIALAAEPDLTGAAAPDLLAPASRTATDWTTTGVLGAAARP